jgi:hypothetical protein
LAISTCKGRFCLDDFQSENSGILEDMNNSHEDFWDYLKDCKVIGNKFEQEK